MELQQGPPSGDSMITAVDVGVTTHMTRDRRADDVNFILETCCDEIYEIFGVLIFSSILRDAAQQ